MEAIAILGGITSFVIAWKIYHLFWSLADAVYESPISYFFKRVAASIGAGLVAYILISPIDRASKPDFLRTNKTEVTPSQEVKKPAEEVTSVERVLTNEDQSQSQSQQLKEATPVAEAASSEEK